LGKTLEQNAEKHRSGLWAHMLDVRALGIRDESSSYNTLEFPWNFGMLEALEISPALLIAGIIVHSTGVTLQA